jgi:hypothetical protein
MAERKTKYTNADLKPQGGPATEYGPWTRTPQVDAEYDKMLGEPTDINEIMAGAKKVVNSNTQFAAARDRDALDKSRSFKPATTSQRIGNAVREYTPDVLTKLISPIANAASLPLMTTPAGMPLAGIGAIESLINPDSSMVDRGMSLAAMLPAAGAAKLLAGRGAKAAGAAGEARKVAEGMYRQTGMSRGVEKPYRMGGSVQSRSSVPRWTDDVPDFTLREDLPVPQGGGMEDVDDAIRGLLDPTSSQQPLRQTRPVGRPSPDYIHPADRSGSMFGFDDLPEISESELAALQKRWGRRR